MDAQWVGVTVAALAVIVSLAAFIRSGLGGVREEIRSLSQQHREDFRSLSQQHREDYAKLEGAIARQAQEHREDFQSLSQQHREDHGTVAGKLFDIAERTARIEGMLVSQGAAEFHQTAAQAVPAEPLEER